MPTAPRILNFRGLLAPTPALCPALSRTDARGAPAGGHKAFVTPSEGSGSIVPPTGRGAVPRMAVRHFQTEPLPGGQRLDERQSSPHYARTPAPARGFTFFRRARRASARMETLRINKALADAGVCSRRKADELVAAGLVRVNGETVVSPGLRVCPERDVIEVRGKTLPRPDRRREPCRLLLHKPAAVVSTVSDPEGRPTVLDLVPDQWKDRRLYPAGRLDFFSEGLLLLTDDGELTHRLTHPSREAGLHLARVYHVLVRGRVSEDALRAMRGGMTLAEGEHLAPVEANILTASPYLSIPPKRIEGRLDGRSERRMWGRTEGGTGGRPDARTAERIGAENTLLELRLHQGLNRQIRRMCRDLDLTVLRLMRVAQGPLRLDGLPPGKTRPLTAGEVAALRRAVGCPDPAGK